MIYKDLRGYIDLLEKHGELVRIRKSVDRDHEATAVIKKMEMESRFEAVLFENVKGVPGWRLMSNTFASMSKLALMLGTTKEKVGEEFRRRIANPIPPRMVASGPVKENIIKGEDIDLGKLPFPIHREKDAGRYLSYGVCVSKDPETGLRNVGFYRHMVQGKDYMVPSYSSNSNITAIFLKAEKKGQPLEVALIPGVDPLVALSGSHYVPLGVDEYGLAGALRGEPVELVKCETVDLEVPAAAEVVIEAEVLPGKRKSEAPFSDFSGCYSRVKEGPIVKVKAITHRNDPIFQTIFTGSADYWNLVTPSYDAMIYDAVKKIAPNVVDVHHPTFSPLMCAISIKKYPTVEGRESGIQKQVMLGALAANPYLKLVIVVDDDVDVSKDDEILWALSFRFMAVDPETREDRMFVIPGASGTRADPSAFHYDYPSAKVCIDATVRSDITEAQKLEFERAKCLGVEKINLKEWLSK